MYVEFYLWNIYPDDIFSTKTLSGYNILYQDIQNVIRKSFYKEIKQYYPKMVYPFCLFYIIIFEVQGICFPTNHKCKYIVSL